MKLIYKKSLLLLSLMIFLLYYAEVMAQAPAPPDPGSTSSGQQIGGTGQIPSPPAPGSGSGTQQIGGTGEIPSPPEPGSGQQIGGGGGLPEPPAPGGGTQIGGNDSVPEPPNPGGGGGVYPIGTAFQTLTIPAGWSGISSQVAPYVASLDSIFKSETQLENLVILQNFSRVYWPVFNINTISNWDTKDGYTIKVINQTEVEIIGNIDENDTISFSQGWNYLPIISSCDVDTEELFGELVSNGQLIIVYEIAGNGVYWPQQGINSLQQLVRGKAYMVKVTESCQLSFPDCSQVEYFGPTGINQTVASPWQVVSGTPIQHFMIIPASDSIHIKLGDIIGAFTTDGICAGLINIADTNTNQIIVMFGDDPTTVQKDGFVNGENISLVLFRPSTSEYFSLSYDIDSSGESTFGTRKMWQMRNPEIHNIY